VIFGWIRGHAGKFAVQRMCRLLRVSRSGYYDWRDRPASARCLRRQMLAGEIRAAHRQSRGTYGSPRLTAELNARRVVVCENTVAKLMREEGLKARKSRRFLPRTTDSNHRHPIAANLLDRRFAVGGDNAAACAPNQVWVCDLTYLPTDQGWLYLWAVLDLFSRRIVGWAMTSHMQTRGAIEALTMALRQRRPRGNLLHHSDRGSQYACGDYQALLAHRGITASMSRRGNCYDNAVMESFFSTLKTELAHRRKYVSHDQARRSIFEWIEVFYNRQRRHSSLNNLSPEAFEARSV
jgi:putative transposase